MALQNVRNKDTSLVLASDVKPRLKWNRELHERFIDAVNQLGGANKATPKSLMRVMSVDGLNLYHLKSHLQKYRMGKNQQSQSYNEDNEQENYRDNQSHFSRKNCDGEQNQINEDFQMAQALRVQMEVQRKLHEQIEVQRHLQLRIEAQGKYLQSVLKKAQEKLAGYCSSSTEVQQAKARLSQLVAMVDTGCLSPSLSVLTESEGLVLKNAKNILPRHTGCSLESSLTSAESSSREEETRPILEFDDNEKKKASKSCTRKRDSVVLSLMEMHPAEKSGSESEGSKIKRDISNIYDGNSIEQPAGKRSPEGYKSHEQSRKFGLFERFDLNTKLLTEFDSGSKAIDLNRNVVEQYTENL